MTQDGGLTVLNAEDFYTALVVASEKYFTEVKRDAMLRALFMQRASDPDTGPLTVGPLAGKP